MNTSEIKSNNSKSSRVLDCFHKIIWYVDIDYDKEMPLEKKIVERTLLQAEKNEKELLEYKEIEKDLGCQLTVISKLINQNKVVVKFHNETQIYNSIKIDLRKKVIWYCRQTGGHYACRLPLSQYKIHFWLKEDLSE